MSKRHDEKSFPRHYLECASLEDAGTPAVLASITLLVYMVLPLTFTPEEIILADFITCLTISLCAIGYLSVTSHASPALLILPTRRIRVRRSLVTVALFQFVLLILCIGIWLLIGMAVHSSPNWFYIILGVLVSPIVTFVGAYLTLPFITAKRAQYLFVGGALAIWFCLLLSAADKPNFKLRFLINSGFIIVVSLISFKYRYGLRTRNREKGAIDVPHPTYHFSNSSLPGVYLCWSLKQLVLRFPFALKMLSGDDSASRWTARRFRERSLSFFVGCKLYSLPIFGGGLLLLLMIYLRCTGSDLMPIIPFYLAMFIHGSWFGAGKILRKKKSLTEDSLASPGGEGWTMGAAFSFVMSTFFLSFLVTRPTSSVNWLLSGTSVFTFVVVLSGYKNRIRKCWFDQDVE